MWLSWECVVKIEMISHQFSMMANIFRLLLCLKSFLFISPNFPNANHEIQCEYLWHFTVINWKSMLFLVISALYASFYALAQRIQS